MSDPARQPPMRFPLPVTIFAGAALLAVIATFVLPLPWLVSPLSDLLAMTGAIVIFGGLALIIQTERTLKRHKTTIRPDRTAEHLVTDGPFRISRNPIYVGMAMLMFGIALAGGWTWFLMFGLFACVLIQKLAIEPEERHLSALFGKRYRDYSKTVKRWV